MITKLLMSQADQVLKTPKITVGPIKLKYRLGQPQSKAKQSHLKKDPSISVPIKKVKPPTLKRYVYNYGSSYGGGQIYYQAPDAETVMFEMLSNDEITKYLKKKGKKCNACTFKKTIREMFAYFNTPFEGDQAGNPGHEQNSGEVKLWEEMKFTTINRRITCNDVNLLHPKTD